MGEGPAGQAGGRRTRRHDLSPELLRSGSGAVGRSGHQRRLRRGGGRADDAGSRSRGHPGRLGPAVTRRWRWTASRSLPPPGGTGRRVSEPAFAHAPAAFVETRRRMSLNGWATLLVFLPPALLLFTIFVILPIGRSGLVQLLQLERLRTSRKVYRPQELRLAVQQSRFPRALDQQRVDHCRSPFSIQLPLALGVALLVAGRITGAVWFRMIFFLPYILADVVAGLIWRFMLDGQIRHSGVLHWLLRAAERLPARQARTGPSPAF